MDVFISYSRKDRENTGSDGENVISKIQKGFSDNGISFWLDKDGIRSGEPFGSVISRNIISSKVFLFVSSRNSNDSRWICGEIATASTYEKRIIPFRIDDAPYNGSIAIYVAALDAIDYTKGADRAIQKLIDSVRGYLNEMSGLRRKKNLHMDEGYVMQFEELVEQQIRMESELNAKAARIDTLLREKEGLTKQLEEVKREVSVMSIDPARVNFLEEDSRIRFYLEHLTDTLYHLKGDFQPVDQEIVKLGRADECQIRFDEACTTVSRLHARIEHANDIWKIFNLSKTNQTFVNGKIVPEIGSVLNTGDEIRLAQSGPVARFIIPEHRRNNRIWIPWLIAGVIIVLAIIWYLA